jgi:Domain of unknown function (DUF4082)
MIELKKQIKKKGMKKIFSLLNTVGIKVLLTLLSLVLLIISCKKEQSIQPVQPPAIEPVKTTTDSIFTSQIPPVKTSNDGKGPIELGVKFRSTADGNILGVKFYKSSGNIGTHTGQLYAYDGTLLASEVFSNETDSGWQTVFFTNAIPIVANKTYIAAYHSSMGNYTATIFGLKTDISNAPLTALADSTDGINGLYKYTSTPALPDTGYYHTNYWIDVLEKINIK